MSLYNKHRPSDFPEVVGNKATISALTSVLSKSKAEVPHAFLFIGATGCGKTTLARIVASKLDCDMDFDFTEVDSADFRGVDTVREIRRNMGLKPLGRGSTRVWLLDECHKMTNDAQNALLKALEDPPGHSYFILATTDPQNLIKTVVGRCVQFDVAPLEEDDMSRLLRRVAKKENRVIPKEIVELIIDRSFGHPRNALTLLEKVIDLPVEQMAKEAEKAAEEQIQAIELCKALLTKKPWGNITKILGTLKEDPETIRRMIRGYASSVILKNDNPDAFLMADRFDKPFFDRGSAKADLVLTCYAAYMDLTAPV